jgi:protein ImuB
MHDALFGAVLAAGSDAGPVMDVAREFSPRVAMNPGGDVVMDLAGLGRLLGDRHTIAAEVRRTAADRGLRVRVALTDGRTAARLLVHQRPGLTVLDPAGDADALAPLPVEALQALIAGAGADEELAELTRTLRRWGVTTLGAFVALPPDDVAARLGQRGVRWQRVASGEDLGPLVPAVPAERFEQAIDLEWPIEGLEPLSFVLSRLLDPMSAHLERRDRGAAVLHIRLHLVSREVHERSLQLPVPMRDARTLRTLLLLDLESHPPSAAIDRVVVAVDPTPARVVQFSLLTKPLPSPEQLSTLMARLQALMGDTRCGAPAAVDSWQPGACAMQPFAPGDSGLDVSRRSCGAAEAETRDPGFDYRSGHPEPGRGVRPEAWGLGPERSPSLALRRFRNPVIARVAVEAGRPVRVTTERRGVGGGRVEHGAGPWRTSGGWWTERAGTTREHDGPSAVASGNVAPPVESRRRAVASRRVDGNGSWDRDEWDVTLSDRVTYRIFRERDSEKWFVEGVID